MSIHANNEHNKSQDVGNTDIDKKKRDVHMTGKWSHNGSNTLSYILGVVGDCNVGTLVCVFVHLVVIG